MQFFSKKIYFFMYFIKIRAHKLPNPPHFCLYLKNTILSFAVLREFSNFVLINPLFGTVSDVAYDGKKAYMIGGGKDRLKWLTKDRIAVEKLEDSGSDWLILERSTDSQPPLSYVISHHIKVSPKAIR